MTTYKEISEKYKKFSEAQQAYVNRMQETANKIYMAFAKSLQLPQDTWKDFDGKTQQYLEFGKIENGSFVVAHPYSIGFDSERFYSFAVKLAIEREPGTVPKRQIWLEMKIKSEGNDILIVIKGTETENLKIPLESDEAEYLKIAEYMKSSFLEVFDDSLYL